MTPLVQQVARILPHPGDDAHWFDLGTVQSERMVRMDDVLMHLPYRLCILCGRDNAGNIVGVRVVGADDHQSVTFAGILCGGGNTRIIEPFSIVETLEGYRFLRAGNTPTEDRELCIGLLAMLTEALSNPVQHYVGEADQGYTSKKRMAHGKPPLRYTWHTVTIGATPKVAVATPDVAGTHASPRAHDRRGHWRKHATKGRVWVRDCRVGDASLGAVFKDYRVESNEGQP